MKSTMRESVLSAIRKSARLRIPSLYLSRDSYTSFILSRCDGSSKFWDFSLSSPKASPISSSLSKSAIWSFFFLVTPAPDDGAVFCLFLKSSSTSYSVLTFLEFRSISRAGVIGTSLNSLNSCSFLDFFLSLWLLSLSSLLERGGVDPLISISLPLGSILFHQSLDFPILS